MTDDLNQNNPLPTTQPHLLIVDDEPEIANALIRQFRRDYFVHTATNAGEALQILQQWPIHVVISDQRMPEVTGVEFFAQIKDTYPETIRVLLTGYADIEAVISAINDGSIFRYIKKPWDRTELDIVVQEAYERHTLITENRRLLTELRQSEQRFRDLFEDSPIALWELDLTEVQQCLTEHQQAMEGHVSEIEYEQRMLVECLAKIKVTNHNRATAALVEARNEQNLTPEIVRLLSADMRDFFEGFLLTITSGKRDYQREVTLSTLRNNQAHVLVRGSVLAGHEDTGSKAIVATTDISDQKRVEDALKMMLDRELELSNLRSRVIETVSHEFRTPLAVIRSSSEMLAEYMDRLSIEQRQDRASRIHTATNRMTRLLDDAIAYSKSSAGEIQLVPSSFDLTKLCHNLIAQVRSSELQVPQILLSHDGECAHVVLDRYVVETAIAHLLQNAVKFSTANGLVKFNISCGPKEVTFTIADEGIGIPQAEQARIFAAFSRASNSGTIPGIGLGLAIVKQLVELHGGIISCERREDVGMIFTVVLPHLTATTNEETISHA